MRRLIRLLLVSTVLYGTGAHWAALQGAAWAGMIATRVRESSWREAVSTTFSGAKPCSMCRLVEKGARTEAPAALPASSPHAEFAFIPAVVHDAGVVALSVTRSRPESGRLRASRPDSPPPEPSLRAA